MQPQLILFTVISYAAEIVTIGSGIGAITTRDYSRGLTDVFQSLALVGGTLSIVGIRSAIRRSHAKLDAVHELLR